MREMDLQNLIRLHLSSLGWIVFRTNVGKVKISNSGRYFNTGLPKGHTDLVCYKNGKTVFLEVKIGNNKPSKDQINFMERMQENGFNTAVVYSVEQAEQAVK